jgi:predicted  nucleic acid-binding Zn-ribbon protein
MENTIENKLRLLYTLQSIDSKIDQLEVLRGELPMEVADLEDEVAGLETRIQKFAEDIQELKKFVTERKDFIQHCLQLKAKYEEQINNVKNSREYDALSKEIELQDLEKQVAEKKIREASARVELKNAELESLNIALEERRKDLESKQAELAAIVAETEKEESELRKHSDAARKDVEERYLHAYDRIRGKFRNGLAVATIQRDSCGGCFNQIPPQVQLDISLRKKVTVCEHCGRIVVDGRIAEEIDQTEL